MGKILILTHKKDGTSDMVVEKLKERRVSCIRFDTENFPEKIKLTIKLNSGKLKGQIIFADAVIDLDDIAVVWNRRPHKPEISSIKDAKIKEWAEEESHQLLKCLWGLMEDKFWVNPITSNEKIQFNKPYQMLVAHKVGLITPHSVLTNCPNDAIRFGNDTSGEMALKVIKSVAVHYSEKILLLHTKKISRKDLNERALIGIRHSPVFLQEYIAKKTELRITVVDKKVFACEIDSQVCKETEEDWRKHVFLKEEIPHRIYDLPLDIKNKCIKLVKELGLYFGAIDMILTPNNEYVFLEVNPNGQWAWIEQLTNMPISLAIADFLIKNRKRKQRVTPFKM